MSKLPSMSILSRFVRVCLVVSSLVATVAFAAEVGSGSICVDAWVNKPLASPPPPNLRISSTVTLVPIPGRRVCATVLEGQYSIRYETEHVESAHNLRVAKGKTAELVACTSTLLSESPEWHVVPSSRTTDCDAR